MRAVGYEDVVYDSGALVAIADPRNRAAVDRHRERLSRGRKIMVPTVVAAQVVRKPAVQARLMKALQVVDNNSATSVGGGGAPLQPIAPEIAP